MADEPTNEDSNQDEEDFGALTGGGDSSAEGSDTSGMGSLPPLSDFDSSEGESSEESDLPPLDTPQSDDADDEGPISGLPPIVDIRVDTPAVRPSDLDTPTPAKPDEPETLTPAGFDTPSDELDSPEPAGLGFQDFAADSEEECIQIIRSLLSFIPQNNMEDPPFVPTEDPSDRMDPALRTLVPDEASRPYDIVELIKRVVDDGNFFEVMPLIGKNLVVGFGRFGGRSVGIVANQPAHLAGVLDIDASRKGGRFVRFCDAFNLPIVTFVDVPGFLPGVEQEHGGIIKHGAKLLYAFCEATVPRVTLITRKAYGGAYVVMSSKHTRADINLAYPTAEIAVMGPDGAVNIMFRNELRGASDSESRRAELEADYRERFSNPYNDTYVPIFFAGHGIKAQSVARLVSPTDIAPTIAAYLGIKYPSGSIGNPLLEVLRWAH